MTAYPFRWPEQYPHQPDVAAFHTRTVSRSMPALVAEVTQ
jgi:hypothetical protein